MTKADLIDEITCGTGLEKQEARSALEGFMGAAKKAMEEGERIELRGGQSKSPAGPLRRTGSLDRCDELVLRRGYGAGVPSPTPRWPESGPEVGLIAQPTTRLEQRSRITDKYSQPSSIGK